MRYRGRRWNNILMLCVIAFIAVLNLPTLIKHFLIEDPNQINPYLLNPNYELQSIHTSRWSLERTSEDWEISPEVSVEPAELVQRWRMLVGTEINEQTYQDLQANLSSPQSAEVWYVEQEEPQRLTYYQTPQFWLLKNWQDKWIAVSVEDDYLIP